MANFCGITGLTKTLSLKIELFDGQDFILLYIIIYVMPYHLKFLNDMATYLLLALYIHIPLDLEIKF
jgi:hypothetical protein